MLIAVLRIIRHAIVVLGIIGFVFGILLEIIPVFSNGSNEVLNAIHITNQQYALDERISKDVLVLTQPGDHSQAILELQVTLPAFEKNQADLQGSLRTNDPTLGLPDHIPGDVQLLVIQSQADYVALDSAARSILSSTDPPIDPNQLAIIQQHERPYFIAMSTIAKVWQGHIRDNALMFFQFELVVDIVILGLVIVYWVLGRVIQVLIRLLKDKQS